MIAGECPLRVKSSRLAQCPFALKADVSARCHFARNGISSTSPFINVDPETVNDEQFDTPYPSISFEVSIARNIPAGEYSLVLQTADGEVSYLVGALTIDDAGQ